MSEPTREQIRAAAASIKRQWLFGPTDALTESYFEAAVEAGVRLANGGLRKVADLTPRQRELLTFIASYVQQHNYAPTYDEMAAAIGAGSKSSIHRLVLCLEERGAISRHPDRVRSISLLAVPT